MEVCDPNPCLNDGYCESSQDDPAKATCNCRMGFRSEPLQYIQYIHYVPLQVDDRANVDADAFLAFSRAEIIPCFLYTFQWREL